MSENSRIPDAGPGEPQTAGNTPDQTAAAAAKSEIKNEAGDKSRRRKRNKSRDDRGLTVSENRLQHLVGNKMFRAWLKQNYPAIRNRTELTPEIVGLYDDYEVRTLRQRSREAAEFGEHAFSYESDEDWSQEFRKWAAARHRIYRKEDVTHAVVTEWHEFELAQHQAYHAKADFDSKELSPEEYGAGSDQWSREKHGYFDFLPNTKTEWAALLQRRADRIKREKLEAERQAAREKADAIERERQQMLCAKLKTYKLPPISGSVPSLVALGETQENYDREKQQLLKVWRARFVDLPYVVQIAWRAYHHESEEFIDDLVASVYLTPRDAILIDDEHEAEQVAAGLRHPTFAQFRALNEGVRRRLKALNDKLERLLNPPPDECVPHRGYTLDEIRDEDERYVLANVIPEGLTVLFGAPKEGKSAWAQKLAVCVSSAVPFDGAEVAPGRVLYVSCDPGARTGAVKRRMTEILTRFGLSTTKALVVVEDPVILTDPASVASLLERNPGKYALVVIDPLYQCVAGSLLQDAVMMEAIKGLGTISRATEASILLIHHQPRGSTHPHLFGSMLLDAALDARIHVKRDKNIVTVKVELLKNGEPPEQPFTYRLEGAYLAPATSLPAAQTVGAPTKPRRNTLYSKILALLPDTATPELEARKLVEHLLSTNPGTRRQQWHRALEALVKARHIERRDGTIRRLSPSGRDG